MFADRGTILFAAIGEEVFAAEPLLLKHRQTVVLIFQWA
jgi:hypothetical protein